MSFLSSTTKAFRENVIGKIIVHHYILGLCTALVVGGGGYWWFSSAQGTSAATGSYTGVARVTTRDIVSTVDAVGSVTFANEQQLKFTQKGTVNKVNVKEGDTVKKGQILAELDKTTVLSDVQQSALGVSASALQLQQLQAEKDKTIQDAQDAVNQAQRQYQQAQTDLTVTQQQLPSAIAAAQRDITDKQNALNQAQLDLQKEQQTEVQNLASTAQDILTSGEKLLDSLYGTLTLNGAARPASGNDTFEISNLLYNDPIQKQKVEFDYDNAVNAADAMRQAYGSKLATITDPQTILDALSKAEGLAQNLHSLTEDSYTLLQGATTDTSTFTAADLQSTRSSISTDRSTAADLIQSALTAQNNLSAISNGTTGIPSVTLKQKEDAVQSAQNSLQSAQDNLSLLQTKNPGDLNAQQDSITQLQEALQSKQSALANTSKDVDIQIQLQKNQIAQKSAALSQTRKGVEDYQIVAPFDGVVSRNDFKVGDNLLADTTEAKYVVLQNRDFLLVTVELDQVDIVRIKEGMPASVELDALPGKSFSGAIETIDPTAITTSGVVSYNVDVKIPMPKDLTILSGMTATVQIDVTKKLGVLTVPNLALQTNGSGSVVKLSTGKEVPVVTGVTDGRFTEIISGLTEGQQIQSINIPTVSGTNSSTATSRAGAAGGTSRTGTRTGGAAPAGGGFGGGFGG